MPSLRSSFKETSGAANPETGEEHVKDLEFDVVLARRFLNPLIKVVGVIVASEAVMVANDSVMQHQGLTPENALGAAGVIAGTMAVRGLSRMVRKRSEAAALELHMLQETAEAERALEGTPSVTEVAENMGTEPMTQELVKAV